MKKFLDYIRNSNSVLLSLCLISSVYALITVLHDDFGIWTIGSTIVAVGCLIANHFTMKWKN